MSTVDSNGENQSEIKPKWDQNFCSVKWLFYEQNIYFLSVNVPCEEAC